MPVTLNAGFKMPSWFDLSSLDVDGPEDAQGIKAARDRIHQLINDEVLNDDFSLHLIFLTFYVYLFLENYVFVI